MFVKQRQPLLGFYDSPSLATGSPIWGGVTTPDKSGDYKSLEQDGEVNSATTPLLTVPPSKEKDSIRDYAEDYKHIMSVTRISQAPRKSLGTHEGNVVKR